MSEPIKPAAKPAEAPTRPASKDDLKALRALISPKTIANFPDMPQGEREDYEAIGPILDRLINAQK